MLGCTDLSAAFSEYAECFETHSGIRIRTHCLYPSFERVDVFVVGFGSGAIIHDGGGALRNAWLHGQAEQRLAQKFDIVANRFDCKFANKQFSITVENIEWIYSAIISVANASAEASRIAIYRAKLSSEYSIIRKTKSVFDAAFYNPKTKLDYYFAGNSGKNHKFDLAVTYNNKMALIEAVVPHHASIAAKYLAFSDTPNSSKIYKYAVFDSDLSSEDKSLITDVADLVSIEEIVKSDGKDLMGVAA